MWKCPENGPSLLKIYGMTSLLFLWLFIINMMDVSLSELRELVIDREAWRAAIHGVAKSRTWLSDWTELNWGPDFILFYCLFFF